MEKEKDQHSKKIKLPKDSQLNELIIKELDILFEYAPPKRMREGILHVYLTYIMQNHEALAINFDDIAEDIYWLLEFLKKTIEIQERRQGNE